MRVLGETCGQLAARFAVFSRVWMSGSGGW